MKRFSTYMQEWLYGKKGYYACYRPIGKEGDFYTAVSASAFFGGAIGNEIFRRIKNKLLPLEKLHIIEIGAHHGYLLADIVRWLYTCDPSLLEKIDFGIIEKFDALKAKQAEFFYEQFGDAIALKHFSSFDEIDADAVCFVANEVLDAFACDLYFEGKVAYVLDHKIEWLDADVSDRSFAEKYKMQKGEIARGYEAFAQSMSQCAPHVEFITFDYGERYIRNDFSIRLYRKHQTYPLFDESVTLKEFFGASDITYDVNFQHVIDAFERVGFELVDYETQARALVRFGIVEMLEMYAKNAPYAHYVREADKIKTLIAPTLLGEKFKLLHMRFQK